MPQTAEQAGEVGEQHREVRWHGWQALCSTAHFSIKSLLYSLPSPEWPVPSAKGPLSTTRLCRSPQAARPHLSSSL